MKRPKTAAEAIAELDIKVDEIKRQAYREGWSDGLMHAADDAHSQGFLTHWERMEQWLREVAKEGPPKR